MSIANISPILKENDMAASASLKSRTSVQPRGEGDGRSRDGFDKTYEALAEDAASAPGDDAAAQHQETPRQDAPIQGRAAASERGDGRFEAAAQDDGSAVQGDGAPTPGALNAPTPDTGEALATAAAGPRAPHPSMMPEPGAAAPNAGQQAGSALNNGTAAPLAPTDPDAPPPAEALETASDMPGDGRIDTAGAGAQSAPAPEASAAAAPNSGGPFAAIDQSAAPDSALQNSAAPGASMAETSRGAAPIAPVAARLVSDEAADPADPDAPAAEGRLGRDASPADAAEMRSGAEEPAPADRPRAETGLVGAARTTADGAPHPAAGSADGVAVASQAAPAQSSAETAQRLLQLGVGGGGVQPSEAGASRAAPDVETVRAAAPAGATPGAYPIGAPITATAAAAVGAGAGMGAALVAGEGEALDAGALSSARSDAFAAAAPAPSSASAATAAAAATPQAAAPPPVATQLAAAITAQASDGRIELRLDPPELGRVEIELSFEKDGAKVVLRAERADALDLMRRHADALARHLEEAGVDLTDLSFEAREDGAGERGFADDAEAEPEHRYDLSAATIAAPGVEAGLQSGRTASGGVDLRL